MLTHRRQVASRKRRWPRLLAIVLALGLAGPLAAAPVAPPAAAQAGGPCHVPKPPPGSEAVPDYSFPFWVVGGGTRTMDLFLPDQPPNDPEVGYPVLIWVHGGGWRNYTQALLPSEGVFGRLDDGYALLSVDYRQTCEIDPATNERYEFPVPVLDLWTSIIWLREYIDPLAPQLNLDTERFIFWGGSTGGHVATLATTAANNSVWADRLPIVGSASLYGVYNLTDARFDETIEVNGIDRWRWWVREALDGMLDCGAGTAQPQCDNQLKWYASPMAHLDADDPPMLIMHGRNDQLVPSGNAEDYWQVLSWVRGEVGGPETENFRDNGTDRMVYFRSTSHLEITSTSAGCVPNDNFELLDGDHGCITGSEVAIVAAQIQQFMIDLIA